MITQTETTSRYIAVAADQLIAICRDRKRTGFSAAEDERVRAIGWNLNQRGGFEAMTATHQIVMRTLGAALARDVEISWSGIGNWLL